MALANMRCRLRTISLLASLIVLFAVSGRPAFSLEYSFEPSRKEIANFEELMGAKWLMCEFNPVDAYGEATKFFSFSPEADRVAAVPPELDKRGRNKSWAGLFAPSVLVFDAAKGRALWLNLNDPADDGENNFRLAISVGQVGVQPVDWIFPGRIHLNVSWGIPGEKPFHWFAGALVVSSQKTAHGHFVSIATTIPSTDLFVAWGACTPHLGDDLRPKVARFRAEWQAADPDDKGEYDQVFWDLYEAIRLNPSDAWAYNNRCWSYGLLRRGEEALPDCNEALRLLPDHPEILDSRALAYWLMGEHDKAQHDLERAREIDPSFPSWQDRFREFEGMFE